MTQILDLFKKSWKSYKYRFLPWLAFNLPQEIKTHSAEFLKADDTYIQELYELFQAFTKPKLDLLFRDNAKRMAHFLELHKVNNKTMLEKFGFTIGAQMSNIPGLNGLGVYVTQGSISKGQLVALYPGAIYEPFQPILFQSIGNQYILRQVLENIKGTILSFNKILLNIPDVPMGSTLMETIVDCQKLSTSLCMGGNGGVTFPFVMSVGWIGVIGL